MYAVVSRAAVLVSVPIVLRQFGAPTYAAWVVAGTLIYSQGLVDFGAGAVARRFIAESASRDSRAGVLAVLRATAVFYLVLSVVIGGGIIALAPTIAGWIDGGADDGIAVIRYAGLAFAATNAVFVFASVLEGCGRVDTSYRLQSVGAILIVPLLLGSAELGAGVHAIGITWLVPPLLVCVLLSRAVWALIASLDPEPETDFTIRSLLGMAGGWQASAWADFASFQLPRVVAGLALPVADLVTLDLALRIAQLVVFPLFAAYPVVLPLAVRTDNAQGRPALQALVVELQRAVFAVAFLGTALAVPVAGVLVDAWTGGEAGRVDLLVTLLIMIGVVSHASTGIVSSTLLALGTVRTIVVYKTAQLVLSLALVAPGSAVGVTAAAAAIAAGLALPAAWFLVRGSRQIGVALPWFAEPGPGARMVVATGAVAATSAAVVAATESAPPAVGVIAGGVAGAAAAAGSLVWLGLHPTQLRARVREALSVPSDAPVAPAPPVY